MTEAEFDSIAGVYDETRRPIDGDTARGLTAMLSSRRCRSILEIGVGTGRVSVPLSQAGLDCIGVDVSRRMMDRARAKGLPNLLLADGNATPLRDKSLDAVVLAHVLHIVENPLDIMREGARVSRVGVFALLRNREEGGGWSPSLWGGSPPPGLSAEAWEERREWFRRLAAKYHWSWEGRRPRDWGREKSILGSYPPDELVQVSDTVVTDAVEAWIDRFRKGAYGFTSTMPQEMRDEVAAEMERRASQMAATGPRHLVYQVAFWSSGRFLAEP